MCNAIYTNYFTIFLQTSDIVLVFFKYLLVSKNMRVMLEIQTILQKNLQTANIVNDYW